MTLFNTLLFVHTIDTPALDPAQRDSRLSALVALVSQGNTLQSWLANPNLSVIESKVRFLPSLPNDVIFGLDQEWIEGVSRPIHFAGGDWMAFMGVQRTGVVWIAVGNESTMNGIPSNERTFRYYATGKPLSPNKWYTFRTIADFGKREWVAATIEGDDINVTFDLRGLYLDFPNIIPMSDRAMTYYVAAIRARWLMDGDGPPLVYFDDTQAAVIPAFGPWTGVFRSDFERSEPLTLPDLTYPIWDINKFKQGFWYLERPEALVSIRKSVFAKSGYRVGVADVNLEN